MEKTVLKNSQINNALTLGKFAGKEGVKRFFWQDVTFMELLKTHQESNPENASFSDLMEAWLNGWDIQNINRAIE
jgi:hypothetical protein